MLSARMNNHIPDHEAHSMKLAHINLVARDAQALAAFYIDVMKCELLRSPRTLSGEKVSRGNGLADSEILSIWLKFPGIEHPFLEIHQHKVIHPRERPRVNEPGFGHLSFEVHDLAQAISDIIQAGGSQIAGTTDFGTPGKPRLIVYLRDPEGNVLELEQSGSAQGLPQ
ncbi:VOC family protein [Rhizobium sp. RU36D]|uniref:VOC family protein n=1 Tax=Rhizobium sp. RU36D TaxID=1907415 RepID=UPI001FCD5142|nr:VOC family protein [Rhizobium sp. RU36D]